MPLASATRVGPYEIVSSLGGGAMGEVYVARDTRLNRNVALKIIGSESSNDELRKRRFIQEARSASALNHPNIVTIHDFGTLDGNSYIVSELVEGESLKTIIRRGPVPMPKLLDIAIQIAAGLAAAHQAGIVHRDLKPDNIMVDTNGRVKILDFGLAKPVLAEPAGEDELGASTYDGFDTEPGLILGTVGYMSPEQARGAPVKFQSDQFSLGVILHEMASGQQAFKRETPMQTLLAISNVDRVPFTPGPVAFRLLVGRCLSKDPQARFASTLEIAERLRKIQDQLPPKMKEGAGLHPAHEELPLRRHVLTAVLAALLLFGLGVLGAAVFSRSIAPNLSNYRFTPVASASTLPSFPAFSPDGATLAYSAEKDGLMQVFIQAAGSGTAGSTTAMQLTNAPADCLFPSWSPDGTRVFYISKSALWSAAVSGGAPSLLRPTGSRPAESAQLPDRRHRVYSQGGHLWLANTATGKRLQLTADTLNERWPAVSADGRQIAFQSVDAFYESWEIPIDSAAHAPTRQVNASSPVWSPIRAEYAFITNLGGAAEIWLKDASSGWQRRIVRSSEPLAGLAFSPDGGRLIYARGPHGAAGIWICNLTSGHEIRLVDGEMPAWSPDGNWISYVANNSLLRMQVSGVGTPLRIGDAAGVPQAWSPRGDWIAIIAPGPGIVLLTPDGKGSRRSGSEQWLCATWSKDGTRLYGLIRTAGNRLALASLQLSSNAEAVLSDLGPFPTALTFASASGEPAVLGASLSPDGATFLTSIYRATSRLWLFSGFPVN